MGIFDALEGQTEREDWKVIRRPPFGYPGNKRLSLKHILPLLPYRDGYIEPFGGSASVLLARRPSPFEIYNDRYSGVTAFYRCLANDKLFEQLIDRLNWTVYSREEFVYCMETWENAQDTVERAARWYYVQKYSFGGKGKYYGRAMNKTGKLSGRIHRSIPDFFPIHERFKTVAVENRNWLEILKDYDNKNHVFYLDPPYVDAYRGTYKHEMSIDEHRQMLEVIFDMDAFVAVSGYRNSLYDSYSWDGEESWSTICTIEGKEIEGGKNNRNFNMQRKVSETEEVLWIKESS